MIKKLTVITLLVAVLLPASPDELLAQDIRWTCDEGPNDIVAAAQTAYDEATELTDQAQVDKFKEAYWLAAQGEVLCTTDPDRFNDAQWLRRRAATRVGREFSTQPGEVGLDDFGLFMVCMGEGSPTIIFENAMGTPARVSWEDVQPAISTMTRTCRYDRRNVGLSVSSGRLERNAVRTTQDQIDDLVLLLENAGIDPPYVLVGHSWGGYITLLFTDQHPEWVQGVVLADASHPDQIERLNLVFYRESFEALTPDNPNNVEHLDIRSSVDQLANIRSFEDRPLVVLTRGQYEDDNAEAFAVWNELQEDYMTFSTNSRHIILENSDHWFQDDGELNLVIDAIVWVIDEFRAGEE